MDDPLHDLPAPLVADDRFRTLAQLVVERFSYLDPQDMLVWWVDHVPVELLPALAEQFHVLGDEGWLFADTVEEQRELIKQAIPLHRKKGTPWAIEEALRIFAFPGRVIEWFDPGGPERGWFNVRLDLDGAQPLTIEMLRRVRQLALAYKNVRSWLDRINVNISGPGTVVFAGAVQTGVTINVMPLEPKDQDVRGALTISHGVRLQQTINIMPRN